MDIELLEKYLDHRCTAEEAAEVKIQLDKDPAILEAYMQQAAIEPVRTSMPVDMEAELTASFRKEWLEKSDKPEGKVLIARPPSTRSRLFWAATAAILIGVAIVSWLTGMFNTHSYAMIEAQAGMVRRVAMPDGSVVWLKPGARLAFDQKVYGGKSRLIELQKGEAFFEVVHNAACPFVVQAGEVQTTDIGTSFDMNKDTALDKVVVTVATGEVEVGHDKNTLARILPGRQISVAAATGRYTLRSLPVWMASVWKDNNIQLNNASFEELTMAMRQLYGLNLHTMQDHILHQTYTMQLKRQTPADQVIRVICLLNQNQFRQNADGSYLVY